MTSSRDTQMPSDGVWGEAFDTFRKYWNSCETSNIPPEFGRVFAIFNEALRSFRSESSSRDASLERTALLAFCDAFNNRGETTSLKEWNERMKVAYANAREALAGRQPYAEPK